MPSILRFTNFLGHPMARDINHQSPPGKSRAVRDVYGRGAESLGVELDKLEKGFHPPQHADRRGSGQASLLRGDIELIGFIFPHGLHRLTRVIAMDHQGRFARVACQRVGKRNSGLPREAMNQTAGGGIKARLLISFQRHAEVSVNHQPARAGSELRGLWHQVVGLCLGAGRAQYYVGYDHNKNFLKAVQSHSCSATAVVQTALPIRLCPLRREKLRWRA